jgi:hypothetical protein
MAGDENKVRLVVYPSGSGDDTLTVSDAMQQVLDHFALLSKAEARDPSSNAKVVWKLESASTNSPFTIEASAISSNPEVSVVRQALQARRTMSNDLTRLYRGEAKPDWFDDEAEGAMRRIIERSLNGIARTDFVAEDAKEAAEIEDLSRKEFGSIEGQLDSLRPYNNKPAIMLKERLSGRVVPCVLSRDLADSIGQLHRWNEVWSNRRVTVSGQCHYDKDGALRRIDAHDVERHIARDVNISEIRDPNFSSGVASKEHLRRQWGDDHG